MIISSDDRTTTQKFVIKVVGMLPLDRNKLFKQFLHWKITLMLNWGNVSLKQLYNLDLTLKENWHKKEKSINIYFSGTVTKVLLGTKYF